MAMTPLTVPAADGQGESAMFLGGWATVVCSGTFDNGTVTVQASFDGGTTWIDLEDDRGEALTFSANGATPLTLGGNPLLRAVLTGGGGGADVTLQLWYGLTATNSGP